MTSNDQPTLTFAVVGPPNRGKSSIVSMLTEDTTVQVAALPGTTQSATRFDYVVDGTVLYRMIDTPGFDRARGALTWINDHANKTGDEGLAAVAAFVDAHRRDSAYRYEVALLEPIVAGAGVLFVVDGSTPAEREHQAELSILRMTGRPRVALINPMGTLDYLDAWQDALSPYFNAVMTLDAMDGRFVHRRKLFELLGTVRQSWDEPARQVLAALDQERAQRRERSAQVIAQTLAAMVTDSVSKQVDADTDSTQLHEALAKQLMDTLRQSERQAWYDLAQIYRLDEQSIDGSDVSLSADDALADDLFSQRAWMIFGLKRSHLIAAGIIGGAVSGGWIDAATLGGSFGIGMAGGAVAGAIAGWFSSEGVSRIKVRDPLWRRLLGPVAPGKTIVCGPVPGKQFAFVVLNRLLHAQSVIAKWSHARRDTIGLALDKPNENASLTTDAVKQLAQPITNLRKHAADAVRQQQEVGTIRAIVDEHLRAIDQS